MPTHAHTVRAIAAALPADALIVRHIHVVGLIATLVLITGGGAALL